MNAVFHSQFSRSQNSPMEPCQTPTPSRVALQSLRIQTLSSTFMFSGLTGIALRSTTSEQLMLRVK